MSSSAFRGLSSTRDGYKEFSCGTSNDGSNEIRVGALAKEENSERTEKNLKASSNGGMGVEVEDGGGVRIGGGC